MASAAPTFHWRPTFLQDEGAETASTRGLILLNQPFSRALLTRLWASASWRACADGGANRLHDLARTIPDGLETFRPDVVRGDLDSLRPDVRAVLAARGVPIEHDGDEDATDLMKCLAAVPPHVTEVVLLGGLSGRLDQTVHVLALLHRLRRGPRRLFAITDDSLGWVLDAGAHEIDLPWPGGPLGLTCGILPVGVTETILSTEGLKWNLTDRPSGFGGLVSTSNHLASGTVRIRTSEPVWWTVEVNL